MILLLQIAAVMISAACIVQFCVNVWGLKNTALLWISVAFLFVGVELADAQETGSGDTEVLKEGD